jgi:hypothetical protein
VRERQVRNRGGERERRRERRERKRERGRSGWPGWHTKLIRMKWGMFRTFYMLLKLIRDRSVDSLDPVYYIRYMGWFRIAILHTKRIRIKKGMFWNQVQVAGADLGQVCGPSVLRQVH